MFRFFHIQIVVPHFLFLASFLYSVYISMASLSFVPPMSKMVELRANGFGVPILFPIDANRFAHVSSLHLSIRFSLHDGSLWVEREIYDPIISLLSLTMHENSILADNGASVWELGAGKYRVYGSLNLNHM